MTTTQNPFALNGYVLFETTPLTSSVVSSIHATATVPASLVATARDVKVGFVNPPPGGGSSGLAATLYVMGGGDCNNGWIDLDGEPENGCEADIRNGAVCATMSRDPGGTCIVTKTYENPTFRFVGNGVPANIPSAGSPRRQLALEESSMQWSPNRNLPAGGWERLMASGPTSKERSMP